jgi:DNA polymerase III gamma/tau subunit
MEISSLNDIKKALNSKDQEEIVALCLRMARYKKENKELLSYLLFQSDDEQHYVETLMKEIDEQFEGVEFTTTYKFTKQVRKILRYVNKHIKYSGQPSTQVELLMHFCSHLLGIVKSKRNQTVLVNMYAQQIKKIQTALGKLHEDLQYDFVKQMEKMGLVWQP